jgi:hypothetical protein
LYRTLLGRSHSFSLLSESHRQRVAGVNRAYAEWLKEQCSTLDLHALSSSPWSTLTSRIIRACGLDSSSTRRDFLLCGRPDTLTPHLR